MRKGDLELLEMRLEPHGHSIDRLTSDVSGLLRTITELRDRVKDLERNEEVHKTEIAQGLASIRSLLQRANRAARETGIIETEDDELPVADPGPEVNVVVTPDERIRRARTANPGRTLL